MRPFITSSIITVLIAALVTILSLTGFAQARDRGKDGHFIRRSHHERQVRDRTETFYSGTRGRHRGYERRHGRKFLSGRTADRRLDRDRRSGRRDMVRDYRRSRSGVWSSGYGGDDFPSQANGGTYFGGLSAWRDPGNGTYFHSERYDGGYGYVGRDRDYRRPGPKIIRVNPSSAGRACSWESGVCVIRR